MILRFMVVYTLLLSKGHLLFFIPLSPFQERFVLLLLLGLMGF